MSKSALKIKIVAIAKKVVGGKIISAILRKFYINNYKKKKIIFIHIPKAAGTSIANVIYGKRNGHLKASFVSEKLASSYEQKYSFSVCRNPYDRLLSAYSFALQGATKDGAIAQSDKYQTPVFASFETFVKEWLVKQDLEKLDPVFQPQHTFVFKNGNLLVNDLFKLENLAPLEKKLSELLDTQVAIGKMNKSNRRDKKEIYYTDELKELVYRCYKEDFRLLNYDK